MNSLKSAVMAKNEKFQLSELVSLKKFLAIVFFIGALSKSWAGIGLPPIILLPPASQRVNPGATATFTVSLSLSLTPVTYQWRHNGTNIPNATARSYTVSNAKAADAGEYSVEITNGGGKADASATLTVNIPPRIRTSLLSNGVLNLHIDGPLIATYIVQSSTDLQHWTSISTNLVVLGLLDWPLGKPKGTGGTTCFYRVLVK